MDPDITALRLESRIHLPAGVACEACRTIVHVSRSGGRALCYACRRTGGGAGETERDHVAGRANLGGLVVDLRANDHRTVTELRLRMGVDTWPPAEGDPLLVLAHVLAGLGSLLFLFAEWLVALAADVTARLGTGVWAAAPPMPVVP
jgi:hypothetical protein